MPNPFPCNSIGNAQCAMANEIKRYRPDLMPLALKRRPKFILPLRGNLGIGHHQKSSETQSVKGPEIEGASTYSRGVRGPPA
jgi:hypothetical protein